jgi:hypothetical protein
MASLLLAILMSTLVLGCASWDRYYMTRAIESLPFDVNPKHLYRVGDDLVLRSAAATPGPQPELSVSWIEWGRAPLTNLQVRFEVASQDQVQINQYLTSALSSCETPQQLIYRALAIADKRLPQWTGINRYPTVVVRIAGHGRLVMFSEASMADSVEGLTMYSMKAIPEATNTDCGLARGWASAVAQMVIHELAHMVWWKKYQTHDDILSNETVAYATDMCLRLEFLGSLPSSYFNLRFDVDRNRILRDERFWELYKSGRIDASLAGWLLSDSLRYITFGSRDLTQHDVLAMNQICAALHRSRLDVRDVEKVETLYSFAGSS